MNNLIVFVRKTFQQVKNKNQSISLHFISSHSDTIDEGTTKHITILSLKYLFLYIKSGRKTFNNHDITSLILKDIHFPSISRKAIKDREKSNIDWITIIIGIERRLYDVISVFCGLGLVKRKTDAVIWTVEEKDEQAGKYRMNWLWNRIRKYTYLL